jgi:hypothetical protein
MRSGKPAQPLHKSPPTDEAAEEMGIKPAARPSNDAAGPDPQEGVTVGRKEPSLRSGDAHNISRDDTPSDS